MSCDRDFRWVCRNRSVHPGERGNTDKKGAPSERKLPCSQAWYSVDVTKSDCCGDQRAADAKQRQPFGISERSARYRNRCKKWKQADGQRLWL